MTIQQVKRKVCQVKKVSTRQIYRYIRNFELLPKVRQKPQQYPATTADVILAHLGLAPLDVATTDLPSLRSAGGTANVGASALVASGRQQSARTEKVLSLKQIKRAAGRTTKGKK